MVPFHIHSAGSGTRTSRIDICQRDMEYAFLGADQRHHFVTWVKVNPKPFLVPVRYGLPQLRQPIILG